ncbi:MAG: shikimate kinase, partial [Actinomycetota bacterium]
MTAQHVVLVGLMGTGKTTVGKRVARELCREFHDSDTDIESREGQSVREIFEARGESEFRELESALLERLLVSDVPLVLSTG